MILVDANLLIYAVDSDSVHHTRVRRWIEQLLSSNASVGLAWIVVLAFIRITTRPGLLHRQLSVEQAIAYVDDWLAQPHVALISAGETHWPVLRNLLLAGGTAGNLSSDAHLAALAIEHGARIASADNDFRRFQGVTLLNPLED